MSDRKWHRGDIHPDTGLVFWQGWYKRYGKNTLKEVWLERAEFDRRQARHLESKRAHYKNNMRRYRVWADSWKKKNPERFKAARAAWMSKESSRTSTNAASLAWKKRNASRFREASRLRRKVRRNTDPLFRLKLICRSRIGRFLKLRGVEKKNRTMQIVGCTPEFLKAHLESLFMPGMNWQNQGSWEIDHRKALATAKSEEEMLALCHFTNLQPLWRNDNRVKGARAC